MARRRFPAPILRARERTQALDQVMPAIGPAATLGYGQPIGGICQTAFVVRDINAAIDHFIRDCGAGPFFLLPHFLTEGQVYRGTPSMADVAIAMGFAGHMQIELIQPLDDNPSVYRETIEARGHGFHHVGIACRDVDAMLPGYLARGYTLASARRCRPADRLPISKAGTMPRRASSS
jgi:hypothetical protein